MSSDYPFGVNPPTIDEAFNYLNEPKKSGLTKCNASIVELGKPPHCSEPTMNMTDKELRGVANRLPVILEEVTRDIELMGSDIIARNMMKGKVIIPNKRYHLRGTQKLPVNHFRVLKSIYKKEGRQGVNAYIVKVMPEIGEYFKNKTA